MLFLTHIPLATDPDTPMWTSGSGKRGVPRAALWTLLLTGLVGIAVLAAGQILVQKERNVVKVLNPAPNHRGRKPRAIQRRAGGPHRV